MFAAPAPVLVERQDRRAARTPYPASVLIDDTSFPARDISSTGVAIVSPQPMTRGAIVRVGLSAPPVESRTDLIRACVARIERGPEGFLVGLKFVH